MCCHHCCHHCCHIALFLQQEESFRRRILRAVLLAADVRMQVASCDGHQYHYQQACKNQQAVGVQHVAVHHVVAHDEKVHVSIRMRARVHTWCAGSDHVVRSHQAGRHCLRRTQGARISARVRSGIVLLELTFYSHPRIVGGRDLRSLGP